MQNYMKEAFGGMFPCGQLEEMGKQNLAMFEQAMKMFSPFPGNDEAGAGDRPRPTAEDRPAKNGMAELERKLDALQKQLDEIPRQGSEYKSPAPGQSSPKSGCRAGRPDAIPGFRLAGPPTCPPCSNHTPPLN